NPPSASARRCRIAPSEREADRVFSCEGCSGRKLRCETVRPQRVAQALLEPDVVCISLSAEAHLPLVHPAEKTRCGDRVAGLGFVGRDTAHCVELEVDEAHLRRSGQPAAEVVARTDKVAEPACRVTEVDELPCT